MKIIGTLAVQDAKKKEQIGYLEYAFLMIKIHYISPQLQNFSFFESQSDQGEPQLAIKPFDIFQTSRIMGLSQKILGFSITPFPFHLFSQTRPNINSETNPFSCMINFVCKYLRQFLGKIFGVALSTPCNIELLSPFLLSEPFQNFHKRFPELPWYQQFM